MDKDKGRYSNVFYALAAAGFVGAIGGLYYVYSLIGEDEDLTEEQADQIQELKQEVEHTDGNLTIDICVQIMAMTTKVAEEIVKKAKPDIDERRRAALNNPEEYERITSEFLEAREMAAQNAHLSITKKFGNFSMEDFQRVLSTSSPMEIEKKTYELEKPVFIGPTPDKARVKEIFMYYGNQVCSQMRELQMNMNSNVNMDPSQQEYLIFRILILKQRLEDEMYVKYKISENQVKYLLYHYNLHEDPDVKNVIMKMSRYDEVMGY